MTFTTAQIKAGRRWAYATMLIMLALSVAGNLSHTFLKNPEAGSRAQTYAIMWPLLVWAGVELFVRIPWQDKPSHRAVRWGGVVGPALIAGIVSYNHLSGLLRADREDWIVYTIGPLAVDGLMLMSTLGLLLTRSLKGTDEAGAEELLAQAESSRYLLERNAELERELEAVKAVANVPQRIIVPASQEVQEHEETLKLADVLPVPVSPAPAIPGLSLGEPVKLAGWTPPRPLTEAPKARTARKTWDEAKARELLLAGKTKVEVATDLDVHPKTIQRLRSRMIEAGELAA
jgi:hypothetical protein